MTNIETGRSLGALIGGSSCDPPVSGYEGYQATPGSRRIIIALGRAQAMERLWKQWGYRGCCLCV